MLISQLSGRVVALDIDDQGLTETIRRLEGEGHTAKRLDLSTLEQSPIGLKNIVHSHGAISGVVHAAGVQCIQPIRLLEPTQYRVAMAVNAEAALALIREFQSKDTCSLAGGSVVLVSSVMAHAGSPGASAYAMTKAALVGLAKSAAIELAPRRIRINCVAPGFVDTAMYRRLASRWTTEQRVRVEADHPLGIGTADDVAHAVAFLLAETGRWITGTVLTVDGGFTAH
jgi:NAD(P)-dependent dehydrogenase (short-subunit alcohol dehydrogenase family)